MSICRKHSDCTHIDTHMYIHNIYTVIHTFTQTTKESLIMDSNHNFTAI